MANSIGGKMLNKELLQLTMKHIEANPEQWDQGGWATKSFNVFAKTGCGTSYCYAGYAVILSEPDTKFNWLRFSESVLTAWETEDGESVDNKARKLLGLTGPQAYRLFNADNTLEDLRIFVDKLCNDEEIEEDEW